MMKTAKSPVGYWEAVYIMLDIINKAHYITDIVITDYATMIIVFEDGDKGFTRYGYIFHDCTTAWGQ